jgi:mannosyl-oligosaccharide alpha-1,2-mannosidase
MSSNGRRVSFLLLGLALASALAIFLQYGSHLGEFGSGSRLTPAAPQLSGDPESSSSNDTATAGGGTSRIHSTTPHKAGSHSDTDVGGEDAFIWRALPTHFPVSSYRPLPTAPPKRLPKVQFDFPELSPQAQALRLDRRQAVKQTFDRCWNAYRDYAWLADEVAPISGAKKNPFGGWGATLVDALDTMWIMGMKDEFAAAVDAVADKILFDNTALEFPLNIFETNIRFLGGLLSAYDLSGDERLLRKARDVGDMLYKAFDTPNHMPIPRWDLGAAADGAIQNSVDSTYLAEIGTFSMEFTRLSILTGDPKYFDASERITEHLAAQQDSTQLPGMWPLVVDTKNLVFNAGPDFSMNGPADSMYEYLIKMVALVGDTLPHYKEMYVKAVDTAVRYAFFRPMTPDEEDLLLSGQVYSEGDGQTPPPRLDPLTKHLGCFTGGMLGLGGKLLSNTSHIDIGQRLTDGCVWAYDSTPTGIMPEGFYAAPCDNPSSCPWSERSWHAHVMKQQTKYSKTHASAAYAMFGERKLPPGFSAVVDPRYILRPEAIESVFVYYRLTGDPVLQDVAWRMWQAIDRATYADFASASVSDVMDTNTNSGGGGSGGKIDSMESFWFSETLKYFYLIFSEPELVSLDEWVFNTEAHPFRRLLPEEGLV